MTVPNSTDDPGSFLLSPLASWAATLGYGDIPDAVAHQARLSLLDTIGCMIVGHRDPDCQKILAADRELTPGGGKEAATVAVSGDALPVPAAAKVNSCMASALELDDNTAGHGSLVTVPVGLAVAESRRLSGRELITSMVAAYEVIGRVLDATFDTRRPYTELGMIPIAAPNTIGAAAQAARLLDLGPRGVLVAMNNGLALLPFSPQVNAKVGSGVKTLVFSGWHVYAGAFGAQYARHGLSAADDSYESEYGGYLRSAATSWDEALLTTGLGDAWYLDAPNRKRHACCGYIHSSIDGMWDILRERSLAVADVASIRVDLAHDAYRLVGVAPLGDLTPRAAQFYLPYVLAVALTEGRPITPADTSAQALSAHLADSSFTALMSSVDVRLDAGIGGRFSCRLHVATRDGREHDSYVEDAVGRGKRQFTDQEVEDKFRALASAELSSGALDAIVAMVAGIEQVPDVSALTAMLQRPK